MLVPHYFKPNTTKYFAKIGTQITTHDKYVTYIEKIILSKDGVMYEDPEGNIYEERDIKIFRDRIHNSFIIQTDFVRTKKD